MLKYYEIIDGQLEISDNSESLIRVYIDPDVEEKRYLIEELGIDPHTVSSALDSDEISRVESEPSYTAVIYKRPIPYVDRSDYHFRVASVGFFLFESQVVLVFNGDIPVFDHSRDLSGVTDLRELLVRLLQRSIHSFIEHIKALNQMIGELESKLSESMGNKYLLNLFRIEQSLVYYLSAISSNGTLIERLRSGATKIGFSQDQVGHLDNLVIDNNQCYKQAEIISDIMASMMDARASVVSNNLNLLMKHLTIFSLVFLPLNLIAGMGGMSEFTALAQWLEEHLKLSVGFSYVLLTTAMIAGGFFMYKWIMKTEPDE